MQYEKQKKRLESREMKVKERKVRNESFRIIGRSNKERITDSYFCLSAWWLHFQRVINISAPNSSFLLFSHLFSFTLISSLHFPSLLLSSLTLSSLLISSHLFSSLVLSYPLFTSHLFPSLLLSSLTLSSLLISSLLFSCPLLPPLHFALSDTNCNI